MTNPYQYLVLRCVPRIDREEFLNVGVVLYCEEAGYLDLGWEISPACLAALDPSLDPAQVETALTFAEAICHGTDRPAGSPVEPLGRRFGMLKAPRSTVLQPGPVHGGVTSDPQAELSALLARLVSR